LNPRRFERRAGLVFGGQGEIDSSTSRRIIVDITPPPRLSLRAWAPTNADSIASGKTLAASSMPKLGKQQPDRRGEQRRIS
jgi:hypothetical protein